MESRKLQAQLDTSKVRHTLCGYSRCLCSHSRCVCAWCVCARYLCVFTIDGSALIVHVPRIMSTCTVCSHRVYMHSLPLCALCHFLCDLPPLPPLLLRTCSDTITHRGHWACVQMLAGLVATENEIGKWRMVDQCRRAAAAVSLVHGASTAAHSLHTHKQLSNHCTRTNSCPLIAHAQTAAHSLHGAFTAAHSLHGASTAAHSLHTHTQRLYIIHCRLTSPAISAPAHAPHSCQGTTLLPHSP